MYKNNLSLICSISERSYEYIKALIDYKIIPIIIITYQKKKFVNKQIKKKILDLIKLNKIKSINLINADINGKDMNDYIIKFTKKNILASLYPGEIFRNYNLLKKKKIIHNHTGILPNYKGSTTIYYSILHEKKIYCSTFIMDKNIDNGKVLYVNEYKFPQTKITIDNFDNKIRARNFLNFLQRKKSIKIKKIKKIDYGLYYTMHPILRYLANKVFNDNLDIR